jgi:hypothetical protein
MQTRGGNILWNYRHVSVVDGYFSTHDLNRPKEGTTSRCTAPPVHSKNTAYVGHVATNTRVRPRDKRTSFRMFPWLHNQFGCSTGHDPLMPWLNINSGQSYRSRRNRRRSHTVCIAATSSMSSPIVPHHTRKSQPWDYHESNIQKTFYLQTWHPRTALLFRAELIVQHATRTAKLAAMRPIFQLTSTASSNSSPYRRACSAPSPLRARSPPV